MAEGDHGDQELPQQPYEQLNEAGNVAEPDERASYSRWQHVRATAWPAWITRDMGLLKAITVYALNTGSTIDEGC